MSTSNSPAFPTAVQWAHQILTARVQPGDSVIDATAGNGHDTLFLSRLVAPSGHVYAFDLQEDAITNTRARLLGSEISPDHFTLYHQGHEHLQDCLPEAVHGVVAAVMFNLGYLPGGDKQVITRPDSTLIALSQAFECLKDGGILSVIAYPGHAGGDQEGDAVKQWFQSLPADTAEAQCLAFLNYRPTTPYLMVARKRQWHRKQPPLAV